MVDLLEALHSFGSCLAERLGPALAQLSEGAPCAPGASQRSACSGNRRNRRAAGYISTTASRLSRAPDAISFTEAVQTQELAQRFAVAGARVSGELQQQVRLLQAVKDEKAELAEQLRALQDEHALLQSNYQTVQESRARGLSMSPSMAPKSPPGGLVSSTAEYLPMTRIDSGNSGVPMTRMDSGESGMPMVRMDSGQSGQPISGDIIVNSRQRALFENLTVTTQEISSLREHGFFVDVLSLGPNDVALAATAPSGEAEIASWELAVRKVYEQHIRQLQTQIRSADGKAMFFADYALDLHSTLQQNVDFLRSEGGSKHQWRAEAEATRAKLANVQDDNETTRKNYDAQLAMLTEHICSLTSQMAEKEESFATLHKQRVMCPRCGMWNAMGKLMSPECAGACHTCKERVLSSV